MIKIENIFKLFFQIVLIMFIGIFVFCATHSTDDCPKITKIIKIIFELE